MQLRYYFLSLGVSLLTMFSLSATAADGDYTRFVNPRIGTGGHGHVFLGADVPFGYIQLGPTQPTSGWDWCSDYHHSDSVLIGFGHQHLSGTGIGDLGDVALLPVATREQRLVSFAHASETVSPGYYAIKLGEPNVYVELTATKRVGMHRYTFGADQTEAFMRLDLRQGIGWDRVSECQMVQESPTTVSGYRHSIGWANRQKDFFAVDPERNKAAFFKYTL